MSRWVHLKTVRSEDAIAFFQDGTFLETIQGIPDGKIERLFQLPLDSEE